MAFGNRGKGTGRKQTIGDKIARERRPLASTKPTEEDAHSQLTVGDVFRFTHIDRGIILLAVTEYDKRCKTTRNNLLDIQGSLVDIDTIRSRNVIIQDLINKSKPESDVTMKHPLRVTLGSALSMHMRWLRKEQDKVATRLVDVDNIEKARTRTQELANKIGEQLVLYIQTEDEE